MENVPNTSLIGLIQPGLFSSVSSILTFCGLYCRKKDVQPDTSRFFWVIKTRLRGVAAFLRRVLQHRVSLVFFNLVIVKPIQFKPIQFKDNIRHDLVVTFFIWGRECRCLQVRCLQSFNAPYPSWPRVKLGTASPFGVSSVFSLQS